jgi:hypothetical protein
MKRTILALAACLVPVVSLAEPAAPVFTPERFRAHVEFLADDLLEGRETGTRGYDIAARYVASQFESFGLEPGGVDGSWFQPVTLQRTTRGEGGALTLTGPGGETRFAHGDNVLVGISPREATIDVSARLVFVGYGLEDKRLGLDDYRGLDVKGAIVVLLRGFPKGIPSEEGAHVGAQKAKVAQKHGAVGILSVSTKQYDRVFPWKRMLEYVNDPDFAWVTADGKAHEEAPAIRARAGLNGPAAEAIFAGGKRTLADILAEADRDKGMPRGFALKTRARVQSSSSWTRLSSSNVVAILRGQDSPAAGEYVTLLAHLDHLGIKDGKIHAGALDNAAGIATLLEVARAAAASGKPKRSMLFLATTGEEKGLLGADYFARHPTVPIGKIVGNVGLDMPLLLYPFTDVIAFGAEHSNLGKIVAEAVAPMNIKLSPDPMPEQGVFTRSDHYALVKQGVPAVFLVTGMANGGDKVWGEFLGGGVYHGPGDNLAQAIDWNAASRFAEVNYRITRAMADSATPPLWYSGDYFGDEFAAKAPRAKR